MNITDLNLDCLVAILVQIPPRDLLLHCQLVCTNWATVAVPAACRAKRYLQLQCPSYFVDCEYGTDAGRMAESRIVYPEITKSRDSVMQCNTLIVNLGVLDLNSIDRLGRTFPNITAKLIFRQCDLDRCISCITY